MPAKRTFTTVRRVTSPSIALGSSAPFSFLCSTHHGTEVGSSKYRVQLFVSDTEMPIRRDSSNAAVEKGQQTKVHKRTFGLLHNKGIMIPLSELFEGSRRPDHDSPRARSQSPLCLYSFASGTAAISTGQAAEASRGPGLPSSSSGTHSAHPLSPAGDCSICRSP
jgi:hypothetical protein